MHTWASKQVFLLSLLLIAWAVVLDLMEDWQKKRLMKLTGGAVPNKFDVVPLSLDFRCGTTVARL